MKLQLDENTLNAYINEAIRQELDENWLTRTATKIGSKAGKAIKGAANGTKNYFKAIGGNKKSVKSLESELGKLKKELDDVVKQQKSLWGTANSGMAGHELVKKERGLRAAIERGERALAQAKGGTRLARTATGTAAAGLGAGYLAGRSGRRGQNPDAPWNDEPENEGGPAPEDGGFDGTFPWDNTTPSWTPKPRKPAHAPVASEPPAETPAQEEPETPAQEEPAPSRPRMEPIGPAATPANVPTGVTSNQPKPTIQRRYAPGTDPNNVNKWNNTANFRRLSGQMERGVAPEKAAKTLQNRRERQEKRYDRISAKKGGQNQSTAQ